MVNFEVTAAALQAWSSQHNLIEEAIAGAKIFLHNNEQDEATIGLQPVFDYRQIIFEMDKQSLVFQGSLPYPYVDTRIGLFLRNEDGVYYRGLEPVGHYRLITAANGEAVDDYLIINEPYQAKP